MFAAVSAQPQIIQSIAPWSHVASVLTSNVQNVPGGVISRRNKSLHTAEAGAKSDNYV